MSNSVTSNSRLLSAEYWNGNNIFDPSIFPTAGSPDGIKLTTAEFLTAHKNLIVGLGQVAQGNIGNLRHGKPEKFNPTLPDGSLVFMVEESLAHAAYNDPGYQWTQENARDQGPLVEPYSRYWLDRQLGDHVSDTESVTFADKQTVYSRSVGWGVITTHEESRVIQPFDFGEARPQPDGNIYVVPYWKARAKLAIPMSIQIGEVSVEPRIPIYDGALHMLKRITSIDVIYKAPAVGQPTDRIRRVFAGFSRRSLRTSRR